MEWDDFIDDTIRDDYDHFAGWIKRLYDSSLVCKKIVRDVAAEIVKENTNKAFRRIYGNFCSAQESRAEVVWFSCQEKMLKKVRKSDNILINLLSLHHVNCLYRQMKTNVEIIKHLKTRAI